MISAITDRCFFFNDTATTEIYTLSLHDALPISVTIKILQVNDWDRIQEQEGRGGYARFRAVLERENAAAPEGLLRSEEQTSELQSRQYLVCRLLLEKKKINSITSHHSYSIIFFI